MLLGGHIHSLYNVMLDLLLDGLFRVEFPLTLGLITHLGWVMPTVMLWLPMMEGKTAPGPWSSERLALHVLESLSTIDVAISSSMLSLQGEKWQEASAWSFAHPKIAIR